MTNQNKTYNEHLAGRLQEIMNILGMTVSGFAEFIGRDSSHIYGILNITRPFSHALAENIGKKLNINGSKILNLNVPVSQGIAKTESVHEFKKDKRNNAEYFSSTLTDRSPISILFNKYNKSFYIRIDMGIHNYCLALRRQKM